MFKFSKKIIIFLFILTAVLAAANFALAATDQFGMDYGRAIGLSDTDPRIAIANLIRIALTFLGIIAVVIIMYGGYVWMTAAGEAEKIDKAKKILMSAIIGLIIILSAFLIVTFVINKIGGAISGCDPACTDPNPKCCGNNSCVAATDICCGDTSCDSNGINNKCCRASDGSSFCASDCGNITGNAETFHVKSTNPPYTAPPATLTNVIRNVQIRFTFTKSLDINNISPTTFTVHDDTANQDIEGSRTIIGGNRLEFIPTGPNALCPSNPCGALNCFASNTQITVTAVNGPAGILRIGTGDRELQCTEYPCTVTFTTGELIDCERPSVKLNADPQLCLNMDNDLGFTSSDDSGVSEALFSDSNGGGAFSGNTYFACPGPDCRVWNDSSLTVWRPTSPGYAVGTNYTISVNVADMDNNRATSSRSNFNLKPEHCCNNELDEVGDPDLSGGIPETGIDCGGDCAACNGAACGINLNADCGDDNVNCDDNRCSSGFCNCGTYGSVACQALKYDPSVGDSCCVCEARPFIDWVSPVGGFCVGNVNIPCTVANQATACSGGTCDTETPNGAVGNFFTISGRNFGTSTGEVWFIDSTGNQIVEAGLANTENATCTAVWTNNQIIAVVPAGVGANRRIRVIEHSTTNDFFGDSPDTFLINLIERPGLCKLNPAHAIRDASIEYHGIRLSGSTAYFGDLDDNIIALNSDFPALTPTIGSAEVPNVGNGRTTSYVINANTNSNFLNFRKDNEAPLGPRIISFSPASGTPGQYVTIMGQGFGATKGSSTVSFEATKASFDFPKICADSIWSDNQVIVKVPAGLTDGSYTINMEIGTWPQINTSQLSPNSFEVDNTLPLLPSACKIFPTVGPNNSQVSLWGEYFGGIPVQPTATVRFYSLQNQNNVTISKDPKDPKADMIQTTVPQMASSGPVSIVQGGYEGNGLNFRIGTCQNATDCGGGSAICCPVGTYKEGQCETGATAEQALANCYVNIPASVFEWDVSTGYGTSTPCYDNANASNCDITLTSNCDPNEHCDPTMDCTCQPNADTCSGYDNNQCNNSLFCPNSPGTCSPYAGGQNIESGNCSFNCDNVGNCTSGTCEYSIDLDRCLPTPVVACDLASTTRDRLGNIVQQYCAAYGVPGNGRWHINTNLSCPNGWTSLIGGRCVSPTAVCNLCAPGFNCLSDNDNDGEGLCGVSAELCPGNATCNNSGKCAAEDKARCECCCEIGQDARDCCAATTCAGTCGSDTSITDGAGGINTGLGQCTGCTIRNAAGGIDVAASDNTCNCPGHTGKYCDTSAAGGLGVCNDCAQLSNTTDCNNHNTTCCSDPKKDDACRGGNGFYTGGVCPYFNCEPSGPTTACATSTDPLNPGVYDKWSDCKSKCGGLPAGSSCYDESAGNCSLNCGTGYGCLGSTGCGGTVCSPYDRTCLCCCDPNATPDTCASINLNAALFCRPNTEPCTSNERGLCCGCKSDSECVAVGSQPDFVGCSTDTCCRARPNPLPLSAEPTDDAVNICRNAEISVEFDTLMDSSSFTGNIIVFGDYEYSPCPAGTVYLAKAGFEPTRMNLFAKIYYKTRVLIGKILSPVLPKNIARALTLPTLNYNYCAVTGSVGSFNKADGHTRVSFSVAQALDEDRLYYALIKGDVNLDSKNGVKSQYGIGMNGPSDPEFNGITYTNSYVWSFRTLAGNNSICKMDSVKVDPASYLFQTNRDDANENDEVITDRTFDTVKDSDKVFIARPKSDTGQTIVRISAYSWTWSWTSNPNTVADSVANIFTNPIDDNKTLLRANPNMTEGKAILTAAANIEDMTSGTLVNDIKRGSANVYLFVCDNPWPPVNNIGEWTPWWDEYDNCGLLTLGGCGNSNYELYYCRDKGGSGTYDDLPAILSDNTIIRGQTPGIYKEYYFFRENIPDVTSLQLNAAPVPPEGGQAALYWNDIMPPVDKYKIYYGNSSGNYTNSAIALSSDPHTMAIPFIVPNLTNNVTYYFNITAIPNTGAESQPVKDNEIMVTPRDTQALDAPTNFDASSSDESVILKWTKVDGAVSYIVSYGANSPNFANHENVGNVTRVEITGLTNGQTYYFGVNSVDNNGNVSATSTASEIPANP